MNAVTNAVTNDCVVTLMRAFELKLADPEVKSGMQTNFCTSTVQHKRSIVALNATVQNRTTLQSTAQ